MNIADKELLRFSISLKNASNNFFGGVTTVFYFRMPIPSEISNPGLFGVLF